MKVRHHRRRVVRGPHKKTQKRARNKKTASKPTFPSISDKTRPYAITDETTPPILTAVDAPYACSKCGLCSDVRLLDWHDPQVPIWNPKGQHLQDRWSECPNDGGPDRAVLADPTGVTRRYRMPYDVGGKKTRACTPYVVFARNPKGDVHFGVVMDSSRVSRELKLQHYRREHGPAAAIDVRRLADITLLHDPLRVERVGQCWILVPWRERAFDEWAFEARRILQRKFEITGTREVHTLASVLEPRLDSHLRASRPPWHQVLHVPIDLTLPVEGQIEDAKPRLVEAREYLYRFTKRGVPRGRAAKIYRNICIFFQVDIEGQSIWRVAKGFFPEAGRQVRERKVRRIVRTMRNAAKVAGIKFPPSGDQLSPLTK